MIEDRPARQPHKHQTFAGDGVVHVSTCEDLTCYGTLLSGKPDLRATPRLIANTTSFSKHPWDETTFVQGGGRGVVFSADRPRRTAFVEAFPRGTFLRGEGTTVEEADDACWAKLQKLEACPAAPDHGPFERRTYTNGAGHCTICGAWFNGIFEPLESYGPHKPTFLERLFSDDDEDNEHRVDVIAEVLSAKIDADKSTGAHIRAAVANVFTSDSQQTSKTTTKD